MITSTLPESNHVWELQSVQQELLLLIKKTGVSMRSESIFRWKTHLVSGFNTAKAVLVSGSGHGLCSRHHMITSDQSLTSMPW